MSADHDQPVSIVDKFDDIRVHAAGQASMVFRTFLDVQARIEDIEGVIETAGSHPQYLHCLPIMGRRLVLSVLSVLSARAGGPIGYTQVPTAGYQEVFSSVDPETISELLGLSTAPDEETVDGYRRWTTRLLTAVDRHMDSVGEGLPSIRDPEGTFPALAIARDWLLLSMQLSVSPAAFVQQ